MKKISITACLLGAAVFCAAQNTALTDGAELLFKDTKSKLTIPEKNALYELFSLPVSSDRKNFEHEGIDVYVQAYVTDINKDNREEVFVALQEDLFYASTAETYMLFIKNTAGQWEKQPEIQNGIVLILDSKTSGWPDIALDRNGSEFPVYQWNGKKYLPVKSVKEADVKSGKIKTTRPADWSKIYGESLK